jgi:hypothetical protein
MRGRMWACEKKELVPGLYGRGLYRKDPKEEPSNPIEIQAKGPGNQCQGQDHVMLAPKSRI